MSFDTQAINKQRQDLDELTDIWVFGYGSLIYKVDFDYLESQYGYIHGYARRFWQGSHDHRGTPESPGRVLTLSPKKDEKCFGRVFKVTHDVFDHLDHREKNGYLRELIDVELTSGEHIQALVYIAAPENAAYLGAADEHAIAQHIFNAKGPSGRNRDYVYQLAAALRKHQQVDPHVFAIEAALRQLEQIHQIY
ncbi:gamma-glutamylcyclotransferase [Alteromonas sp. ASW11-36]|uniref:glutathione-specific gamma-glutamylcyclotransferase n=1 Tax=Alteromonas arenosi TaxID=3055817 RepID=A0ABT7SZE7_9ALTE|nr:gamma-glutamylcyclotransferase [Alteromonas sp. ASW11-36]MDM7861379.1 gamma-glutamylcyclotransferase [Alteromonas sp. ASW11-36]